MSETDSVCWCCVQDPSIKSGVSTHWMHYKLVICYNFTSLGDLRGYAGHGFSGSEFNPGFGSYPLPGRDFEPLVALFEHSFCLGEVADSDREPLIASLTGAMPKMTESFAGIPTHWRGKTQKLIDALRGGDLKNAIAYVNQGPPWGNHIQSNMQW